MRNKSSSKKTTFENQMHIAMSNTQTWNKVFFREKLWANCFNNSPKLVETASANFEK
jgi:hypothetical protein